MSHSLDIRKRVVEFIKRGGSKAEAARKYEISRGIVYRWLKQGHDLSEKPRKRTAYRIDRASLEKAVSTRNDFLLRELAEQFGVSINTIHYNLTKIGISRKKNHALRRES